MWNPRRPIATLAVTAGAFALATSLALAAPTGKPIRIGSTLALTGPLAATG